MLVETTQRQIYLSQFVNNNQSLPYNVNLALGLVFETNIKVQDEKLKLHPLEPQD